LLFKELSFKQQEFSTQALDVKPIIELLGL
jgi:hypothetical protein